jgi:hypothetical protein
MRNAKVLEFGAVLVCAGVVLASDPMNGAQRQPPDPAVSALTSHWNAAGIARAGIIDQPVRSGELPTAGNATRSAEAGVPWAGSARRAPGALPPGARLPDVPPNDLCQDATLVTPPYPALVSGDNTDATTDCSGGFNQRATWWEIELPYESNILTISYCGQGFEIHSANNYVYHDCADCSDRTIQTRYELHACSDGVQAPIFHWHGLPGPGTVLFPVFFNSGAGTQSYTIEINVQESAENDDCEAAIPIGEVIDLPFDTRVATASAIHPGSFTNMNMDLFYCYTATCTGPVIFHTCDSDYDTRLAVWAACDCPPTTTLAYNDDDNAICGLGGEGSAVEVECIAGESYLVQIGGAVPAEVGCGLLSILCYEHTGACCFGDDCQMLAGTACVAAGGEYIGEDLPCSPNPCTEAACFHRVELYSTTGLGWTDSRLDVFVNGALVLDGIHMDSPGHGPTVFHFFANHGDEISTVFTPGIWWSYQTEYYIYDGSGYDILLALDGVGDVEPTGITTTANCVPPDAGACCYFDGTCAQVASEAECIDGMFLGLGVTCDLCPCMSPCPAGAIAEQEACGETANDGCNIDPSIFEPIACGDVICGTYTAEDHDWYEIVVSAQSVLTWTVVAESRTRTGFIEQVVPGVPGCDNTTGYIAPFVYLGPCEEGTLSMLVEPGTYYAYVAHRSLAAPPCDTFTGTHYVASLTCNAPIGACCRVTEPFCTETTEANCDGTWLGPLTQCSTLDCNSNGVPDECELVLGLAADCNGNGVPDDCDIDPSDPDGNGQVSADCQPDLIPDECQLGITSTVVWDNGPFITSYGTGCAVEDESYVESESTYYGWNCSVADGWRTADDFTLTQDCRIHRIKLYAYQSDETPPTIHFASIRLWDGPPGDGGAVVFGDTVTNYCTSSSHSGVWRVLDDPQAYAPCARGINEVVCAFGGIDLPAGTYWLDFQLDGAGDSGPWWIPVTPHPARGNTLEFSASTGWSMQYDDVAGWTQSVAFIVEGSYDAPANDCNENGVPDDCDIAAGTSQDLNGNGIPDECEGGTLLGDMNCDGAISPADIDPFVIALTGGQAAYEAQFPDCNYFSADVNGDGTVSAADIDPFVQILTGG